MAVALRERKSTTFKEQQKRSCRSPVDRFGTGRVRGCKGKKREGERQLEYPQRGGGEVWIS
jgi:hypothetical protein